MIWLQNAPEVEEVLKRFHEWTGDAILVAHNASFDMGFLNVVIKKLGYRKAKNPVIDTLGIRSIFYIQK